VFRRDAAQAYSRCVAIAADAGFEALVPCDGGLAEGASAGAETAMRIYRGNVERIDAADVVVANLNEFRGSEPDSGTSFEVGYAVARGKRVIGFVATDSEYMDRVKRAVDTVLDADGVEWDKMHGMMVERMGLPLNLMLACSSSIVVGDFADAVRVARRFCVPKTLRSEGPQALRGLSVRGGALRRGRGPQ